ncbi:MAG: type II secretion system ATPase GspE [Deltaproteobacteria bacterium]|nr:type II secretion system ATPase GspE [Deltaproteobacteria bacterium]
MSYLGEILVRRGALTEERLGEALKVAAEKGGNLQDVIVQTHAAEERDVLIALAAEFDLDLLDTIDDKSVPPEVVSAIPINFAKARRLLPVKIDADGAVVMAISDPLDTFAIDDVRAMLGREIVPVLASGEEIIGAINRIYERKADADELDELQKEEDGELGTDILDSTDEAPIIRWVNGLFFQAARERASDIHIEPSATDVVVRYRIDGVLKEVRHAPRGFLANILARVKIMASLNIAEKRLPQDGRIGLKIAGRNIDVRVSTIPTSLGERVVMRLLDKTSVLLDLTDLGFEEEQLHVMDSYIRRPHGIILVTGPTGSGKTTTLYACITRINTPDKNILTVEDPVEYDIKGISQMQVNPKINLTFASGLRAFLRQDPDVILVGEIRDPETAAIAITASQTGHLVLSTVHTNDAAGAVTRLVEMDVQPFLLASTLMCVLAQRLVRVLCESCKQPYEPLDAELGELGIGAHGNGQRLAGAFTLGESGVWSGIRPTLYRAAGCPACLNSGYRGRVAIYELLPVTDEIRQLILRSSDSNTIKRAGMEHGMETLRDAGARKVLGGVTSADEVMRVTREDEE